MSGVANAFARTDVVPPVMSRKHAEILFAHDEVSQVGHPAIQPTSQPAGLGHVLCFGSVCFPRSAFQLVYRHGDVH